MNTSARIMLAFLVVVVMLWVLLAILGIPVQDATSVLRR